jgi:hypothetical protein
MATNRTATNGRGSPTPRRARTNGVPKGAVVLDDGTWVLFDEMTGRDLKTFLALADDREPSAPEVAAVLDIIERRVRASSVSDPLDLPMRRLFELMGRWVEEVESTAVPPVTASS